MNPLPSVSRPDRAFTLMELMIVMTIIAILAASAVPVYNKLVRLAEEAVCIRGLQQLASATTSWAAEHSGKLPSPKYSASDPGLPDHWKLDSDGEEGLWLNGVIYAQLYLENSDKPEEAETGPATGEAIGTGGLAESGKHLVGTVFESRVSIKRNPTDRNWYHHSYAMNANLMYDEIAKINGAEDPWLTEKSVSKFEAVSAMLFIDCIEPNIVMAADIGLVHEAAEKRHEGKHVLAAFLDGHVDKIKNREVPEGDPETDRNASMFWRGILPER